LQHCKYGAPSYNGMSSDFVVDHPESDEDPLQPQHEKLVAVRVRFTPESSPDPADPVKAQPVSPASTRKRGKAKRRKNRASQGDTFLLTYLAPNHPDIAKAAATTPIRGESESEVESGDSDESMSDIDTKAAIQMERNERDEKLRLEQRERDERFNAEQIKRVQEEEERKAREEEEERRVREEEERKAKEDLDEKPQIVDNNNAVRMAAAALGISHPPPHPASPTSPRDSKGHSPTEEKPSLPSINAINGLGFQMPSYDRSARHPVNTDSLQSPLEVRKLSISNGHPEESLITSPLGVHLKQSDSAAHRLPALQSPGSPDAPTSPQHQKLPGFQQINEIANKANETISRRYSITAHSPMPYSGGPVRSPHSFNHASPSLYSDTSPRPALSPPSGTPGAFMFSRRPSQPSDYPPPLASASTTDSSYASTEGYSPSTQQTPQSETHRMSLDGTGPPILPPPVPSMQPLTIHTIPAHGSGGFRCDHPGCTAPPFQTQYLLK
jgi:hypothetical protein